MKELQKVFQDKKLTIIDRDGEPWFLLKDVCSILEIDNHRQVKTRLNKGVISKHGVQTNGGMQKVLFVNEDGLYDVILDSRKPEAVKFKKWITKEVLPSIRKHGMYATPSTIEDLLNDPDTAIEMLQKLKQSRIG